MLALFCLRLGVGLVAALALVSPRQVNPRFYRTHFLVALGLGVVAAAFLWGTAGPGLRASLLAACGLAFAGSVAWSLERAPGGRVLIALTALALVASLGLLAQQRAAESLAVRPALLLADDLTSAALLGTALTAMLLGHLYLIAPGMAMTPLLRLLAAFLAALVLRLGVASVGLWSWTAGHSLTNLEDETVL